MHHMASMTGSANPWCLIPIALGATLSTYLSTLAAIDFNTWTTRATAALGLAGLVGGGVVGGLIWAINRYDTVRIARQRVLDDAEIARRKLLEEANKGSLTAQLEEMREEAAEANRQSLENQKLQRESLHVLKNEAQVAKMENHELRENLVTIRKQFLDLSKQLHETDRELHASSKDLRMARDQMSETNRQLVETIAKLEASEEDRVKLAGRMAEFQDAAEKKLENLAITTDSTHDLVNGAMTVQLKISAVALRRIADITRHPDDEAAAVLAETSFREHEEEQKSVLQASKQTPGA
jgi:hypothetical protein